jgi:hypothetical protein
VERVGVACARGVGAQLVAALQGQLPEAQTAAEPRVPTDEGGEQDSSWACWAAEHGFVPAASPGVPGSLGIRVLASPAQGPPNAGAPARQLIWADAELGARVWAW